MSQCLVDCIIVLPYYYILYYLGVTPKIVKDVFYISGYQGFFYILMLLLYFDIQNSKNKFNFSNILAYTNIECVPVRKSTIFNYSLTRQLNSKKDILSNLQRTKTREMLTLGLVIIYRVNLQINLYYSSQCHCHCLTEGSTNTAMH